jgi:hypothetical protein
MLLGGVVVNTSGTQLTATMPALPPGSYLLEVSRHYWWYDNNNWWYDNDNDEVGRLTVVVGANGEPGKAGSKGEPGERGLVGERGPVGERGERGEKGEKGDAGLIGAKGEKGDLGIAGPQGPDGPSGARGLKGDQGEPGLRGMPGNLALAGRLCPAGISLRGFSATGDLVCGEPASCGNGTLENGEEFDPPSELFSPELANAKTCKFDFSRVTQLYCNATCSVSGESGCDQADADLLCKLQTGNADAVAGSFSIETALAEPGFSCPWPQYGTPVPNLASRGVRVPVYYSEAPLLATHGEGQSVTNVVCKTP